MNKKNRKFNYKYLLASSISIAIVSTTMISLYCTFNQEKINNLVLNQNLKSYSSSNIGKKVGNIRRWQNNNFDGIEVKNGGFVVLTETQSATRIDAFGNILWEFDPQTLSSDYPSFANKKVVEITQDEGINQNILYLLLVPTQVPNEQTTVDVNDAYSYNDLNGSNNSNKQKQATVVQIVENVNSYTGNNWTPSYTITGYMDINPKKMVDNYPSLWKQDSSNSSSNVDGTSPTQNTFFTKEDHPSWYVTNNSEKVNNSVDQNSNNISSNKMVLPWKQYVTNLGNMFAKDGILLIFGGNGSIYNDPEALSIGMWKLDFTKYVSDINNNQNYGGIPYAYLLRYLKYNPSNLSLPDRAPNRRWNESYAPIGQTSNFTYVPRLAVAGIQGNASSYETTYIYLAAGITVGQVKESQNRNGNNNNNNQSSVATTIQDKRSLQLTGANTIVNTQDTTANSIDPALLFGTAFNVQALLDLPISNLDTNINFFQNVFQYQSYFDIGATMSVSSAIGTYYYFDNKNHSSSGSTDINSYTTSDSSTDSSTWKNQCGRSTLSWEYAPTQKVGDVFLPISSNNNNNKASYSYNLSLLIENAINYYYPTLSFGYSLKSLGGLTKVQMQSKEDPGKTIYGYAMQVGKSIVYLNEPKSDLKSLAYHGPSSISIGDSNLVGQPKYKDMDYPYVKISNQAISYVPASYKTITNNIINTGVAIYVTGIKDFNDTIPTITSQFEIGNSPYEDNSSNSKTNGTLKPNISWNDFVGLNSTNSNSEISSLWLNNNNSKINGNEYFIATKSPEISEYYGDAIWHERFYYNYGSNNRTWHGPKRAWFEAKNSNDLTINSTSVSWQVGLNNNLSTNSYFVQPNNQQQTNGEFDVLLKTRDDSSKNESLFFGQIHNSSNEKGLSYRKVEDVYGQYEYNTISNIDRFQLLGTGSFVSTLNNQILTNNLSNLLEQVSLSTINGNLEDSSTMIRIVKSEFASEIFKITKEPIIQNSTPPHGSVIIVASNTNFVSQTTTLTAYSWNSLTKTYDVMPRTNSISINQINNSVFSGFSALADWIFPIIIAVPIVLVALIIGLGCGIGIPMSKHKKAIKVGFELQHEKVGTLTTAVGGVFKKIIDNTNANNMKAKPQMLKAGGSKPAPSPSAAPAKPTSVSNAVPKPAPSAAPAKPSTPNTFSN
ncbi:hypothetical protein [Mycoplasmoides pirum]|uniref:hypothetical protein n=1 Tax=Mycoplasmoides pirum TaxID=2122 RepID=UPI000483FC34|nr:hypothetical protein [Mycoplasmoides pirum]